MIHNFADWELTKLLPQNKNKDFEIFSNEKVYHSGFEMDEDLYCNWAWTWEDIRLYLKKYGYEIQYYRTGWFNGNYCFKVLNYNTQTQYTEENSNTYEEARKQAIEHCLKSIMIKK